MHNTKTNGAEHQWTLFASKLFLESNSYELGRMISGWIVILGGMNGRITLFALAWIVVPCTGKPKLDQPRTSSNTGTFRHFQFRQLGFNKNFMLQNGLYRVTTPVDSDWSNPKHRENIRDYHPDHLVTADCWPFFLYKDEHYDAGNPVKGLSKNMFHVKSINCCSTSQAPERSQWQTQPLPCSLLIGMKSVAPHAIDYTAVQLCLLAPHRNAVLNGIKRKVQSFCFGGTGNWEEVSCFNSEEAARESSWVRIITYRGNTCWTRENGQGQSYDQANMSLFWVDSSFAPAVGIGYRKFSCPQNPSLGKLATKKKSRDAPVGYKTPAECAENRAILYPLQLPSIPQFPTFYNVPCNNYEDCSLPRKHNVVGYSVSLETAQNPALDFHKVTKFFPLAGWPGF
ncbi:hypothetical protein EV401DRAFT_1886390 [Pisolithus croceorrhizus]|nr:hypothetical protein EV401DRAFT_1886390 [Pisolithus croceorrhizus]